MRTFFDFSYNNLSIVWRHNGAKTFLTRYKINASEKGGKIITGADQTNLYIEYLKGKNIGMVINQTSVIG